MSLNLINKYNYNWKNVFTRLNECMLQTINKFVMAGKPQKQNWTCKSELLFRRELLVRIIYNTNPLLKNFGEDKIK